MKNTILLSIGVLGIYLIGFFSGLRTPNQHDGILIKPNEVGTLDINASKGNKLIQMDMVNEKANYAVFKNGSVLILITVAKVDENGELKQKAR